MLRGMTPTVATPTDNPKTSHATGGGVTSGDRTRLLYMVTNPLSARYLLRGQLADMERRGYAVTLVTSPGPDLVLTGRREGVETIGVRMRREIAPLSDLRSLRELTRVLRQVQPAITKAGTPKAGLLGGLAAVATGVPCRVYMLHGLRMETATGFKRVLLWMAEWVACRTAHRVISVSPSLLREAERLRLLRRGSGLVLGNGTSNGTDYRRFAVSADRLSAARALREELQIPDSAPVVGFVGRLTTDKGILELLTAHRSLRERFPDLRLLLVGGTDPDDPLPVTTASLLRSSPGVIETGWLADTPSAYHAMDVLALPTLREGFPNVSLEAAAAGLPVVTTSATGAVDSVVDGVTGFIVPPRDPYLLAGALGRLLDDPQLARQMGDLGLARVQADFDQHDVWDRIDGLFRQMTTESGILEDGGHVRKRRLTGPLDTSRRHLASVLGRGETLSHRD